MKFRGLKPEEIDVRVGTVQKDGATLLLYKDARVDMAILDETVGAENWMRDHKEVKGNLFCGIGIKCGDEWVYKWDCGTESNMEKEKGESSDSFKRAGFNWGIGRELYTAPKTKVRCKTTPEGNRYKLANPWEFFGAYVETIEYRETETARYISKLVICNQDGKRIFSWREGADSTPKPTDKIGDGGVDYLESLIAEVGADKEMLLAYYEVSDIKDMTVETYKRAVATLEARKNGNN